MKRIKLSGKYGRGKFAKVDNDNYENLNKYTWYVDSTGYARRTYYDGSRIRVIRMHSQIMGKSIDNCVVDHINRDRLDNRKLNLRFVTQQINAANKGIQSNNTSGVIGVSFCKVRKVWTAQLASEGKTIMRLRFKTMEQAVTARKNAERELEVYLANRFHRI